MSIHSHDGHRSRGRSPAARARSLPHRAVFVAAMLWSAVHYLCLCAWITCLVMFVLDPTSQFTCYLFVGALIASVLSWIWAYFKRRAARCPLCKGTPLLNSGALPHGRAVRIPPLNYGVTATLSLLCTQEFRCMYCGSLYDLLKPSQIARPAPDPE